MQQNNGLLESSENSDFVSLYDNALAVLVFTTKGRFDKAERILDFFSERIEMEFKTGTGGFYQFRNADGKNGSRRWLGDNAWLLIAVNNYHKAAGNQRYRELSSELEDWIRSLQDQSGGLYGGYNEDGTQIHKITEGILTAYNAVSGYDEFHRNILRYLKENRWVEEENLLVAWPENAKYNYALDLHALSYTILDGFPEKGLQDTSRYQNTQMATVSGEEVTGFCFDEDKDVVWLEGTAQMAVAYQHAGNIPKADKLILETEKTMISSTVLGEAKGIPYATNHGTSYGNTPLWDHADITPALSSTAWYLFAKMAFNPFYIGQLKNIPEEDKFWLEALSH